MTGICICQRRVLCKFEVFPSGFAMIIIISIRHYVASERVMVAMSSSCLFGGTRLSWLGFRWASVVKLG